MLAMNSRASGLTTSTAHLALGSALTAFGLPAPVQYAMCVIRSGVSSLHPPVLLQRERACALPRLCGCPAHPLVTERKRQFLLAAG